jgi:NAD(P)-dependent dehydrogenase (short-subunit alcohol dehydrogenase family)
MDPRGRVALVTGAGSGIGFATCVALARRGASVAALDVDAAGLESLSAVFEEQGGELLPLRADVTRWEELAAAFTDAERHLGGLDVVCNNAGVNTGRPRFPFAARERWERTIAIDLWAVMAGVQLAVEAMRGRGGGVVVSTGSLAALTPFPADPAYAAAKAAVVALTRSLGFLEDEGIRAVCLCPGMVDTPLLTKRDLTRDETELVRSVPLLRAEEVADEVVRVVEDQSLHAVVLGLLPGRPPKVIPAQLSLPDDPTAGLES